MANRPAKRPRVETREITPQEVMNNAITKHLKLANYLTPEARNAAIKALTAQKKEDLMVDIIKQLDSYIKQIFDSVRTRTNDPREIQYNYKKQKAHTQTLIEDFENEAFFLIKTLTHFLHIFGFELTNKVLQLGKEGLFFRKNASHIAADVPTSFYIAILFSIVLIYSDENRDVEQLIEKHKDLQKLLFTILEENAITGIFFMMTHKDFSNLQQANRQFRIEVPKHQKNSFIKTAYIINKITNHKYLSIIMPYQLLIKLKTALEQVERDARSNFVRNQNIFIISNSTIIDFLKLRLGELQKKNRKRTEEEAARKKEGDELLAQIITILHERQEATPFTIRSNSQLSSQSNTNGVKAALVFKGGSKTKKRMRRKTKKGYKAKKGHKRKQTKKHRKGSSVPMRYVPHSLSAANKAAQKAELKRSRKAYRKGKGQYYTRKKMSSFKSKVSPHILKARKVYGIEKITPSRELAKATKCTRSTLRRIEQKGLGAYFSSGSRPSQTAHSWGRARLASAITGGKASAVDLKQLEKGCKPSSKALKMAKKAKGYGQRRVPQVKL